MSELNPAPKFKVDTTLNIGNLITIGGVILALILGFTNSASELKNLKVNGSDALATERKERIEEDNGIKEKIAVGRELDARMTSVQEQLDKRLSRLENK